MLSLPDVVWRGRQPLTEFATKNKQHELYYILPSKHIYVLLFATRIKW
jgi:hypothetical protein